MATFSEKQIDEFLPTSERIAQRFLDFARDESFPKNLYCAHCVREESCDAAFYGNVYEVSLRFASFRNRFFGYHEPIFDRIISDIISEALSQDIQITISLLRENMSNNPGMTLEDAILDFFIEKIISFLFENEVMWLTELTIVEEW
jgi:hypothetical protein